VIIVKLSRLAGGAAAAKYLAMLVLWGSVSLAIPVLAANVALKRPDSSGDASPQS
jgi:hypothetical protein